MLDFSKIKNESLRTLVMTSASILSQPEARAQQIIDSIANLPSDKEQEMMAALQEEQKTIQNSKLAQGVTPESEIEEVEKDSQKLSEIKHEYDTSVRKNREEKSQTEDAGTADNILESLQNIP